MDEDGGPRDFRTTRWSMVLAAGREGSPEASRALERLAESYWYPLYAYARRRGLDEHGAEDATQGLFAQLLERRDLATVAPEKGRFRSFLLAALRHHIAGEHERAGARKRGGGARPLSIDAGDADSRYRLEPAADVTPERLFEQSWARSVLDRALERLRADYEGRGQGELHARLADHLVGAEGASPYRAVGEELGMAEGAVKVAVHRLRRRFRAHLKAEIADTVADPSLVEDEIRFLFAALAG